MSMTFPLLSVYFETRNDTGSHVEIDRVGRGSSSLIPEKAQTAYTASPCEVVIVGQRMKKSQKKAVTLVQSHPA